MTVSDEAGNTAATTLTFPAVAKGDQTLSGFAYSAASVTFGNTCADADRTHGGKDRTVLLDRATVDRVHGESAAAGR